MGSVSPTLLKVRVQRPSGVVNSFRPEGCRYEDFAPYRRNATWSFNHVRSTNHPYKGTSVTGTTRSASGVALTATETQARSKTPRDYQQTFNQLPEQRKHELARVVAGMTQVQGRVAAQRWLGQQLETASPQRSVDIGCLSSKISKPASMIVEDGSHLLRAAAAADLTPNQDQLVENAPTTLATLSPDEKQFLLAVEAAEAFSQEQLELATSALTPQSTKVFEFLHLFACSHALSEGQSLKAHQISFFLPAETIHLATGVPKRTVYDALRRIKALRLVDYRGHVTTLAGYGNRCDGTVFAVKLNVLRTGEARVTHENLKASNYRNLEEDIQAGRTVFRLAQSGTWGEDLRGSLCRLLGWLRSKCTRPWGSNACKPRFLTVQASSRDGLEAILDITSTNSPKANRGARIGAAASAIARALGDQHSLPFWNRFCDGLASLVERGGQDYTVSVKAFMQREITAKAEGFARCPAALFISRLKATGVYREIMAA